MPRSVRLGAVLFGAALLVALAFPTSFWEGLPDLCLVHRWTGRPCPTCGLTRSWSALLHGEVATAFHYHLLGPILAVGLPLWMLWGFRKGSRPTFPAWLAWGLALLWTAYVLGRMVGWWA